MKLKQLFSRYCRPVYIVLTVLLCLFFWLAFRCYTKPGPDALEIVDVEELTILETKAKTLELIDSEHITIVGYEPDGIFYLHKIGDLYVKDDTLKKEDDKIIGVRISWPAFFEVRQALTDKKWQFYQARRPGLHANSLIKKAWFGRAPCWPRESAADVKFTEKELLSVFLKRHKPAHARIYEVIAKVKNNCTTKFSPHKAEPIQTIWTSQTLNYLLFKTRSRNNLVLWQVSDKSIKTRQMDSDETDTEQVSDDRLDCAKKKLSCSFGLVPVCKLSDIPENSQWSRVPDDDLQNVPEGIEVYDLTWNRKSTSSSAEISRRFRIFVNSNTNLPQKAEWYHRMAPYEKDYHLGSTTTVDYLTAAELMSVIKDAGF